MHSSIVHLDWTHLTPEPCADDVKTSPFLSLPTDVIDYIFKFFTDKDLRRARWTCSSFVQAYCKNYCGSTTPGEIECASYITLCELGYVMASVTHLNIKLPYQSLRFRHLTKDNFPSVINVTLNYVHVGCLPTNGNVLALTMNNCTFHGKRPRRKERQFPFYNVKHLRVTGGTTLHPDGPLPRLLYLKRVEIVDTVLTHPLTCRKFPRLSSVELRGESTLMGFPNLRCPKVHTLALSHPELFPVNRINQFFWIVRLKLELSQYFYEDRLSIMVHELSFPKIETLELEFGIHRFHCDLGCLAPLSTLKQLQVNLLGSVDPWALTNDSFGSLRRIIFNADVVDLNDLPPHNRLREIVVPRNTAIGRLCTNGENWPRLVRTRVYEEGMDEKLAHSDVESTSDEDDEVIVKNEAMVFFNDSLTALQKIYDEKMAEISEEKLREEKLKEQQDYKSLE